MKINRKLPLTLNRKTGLRAETEKPIKKVTKTVKPKTPTSPVHFMTANYIQEGKNMLLYVTQFLNGELDRNLQNIFRNLLVVVHGRAKRRPLVRGIFCNNILEGHSTSCVLLLCFK